MTEQHGVVKVDIDKKNNFHYICKCGRDSPSIEIAGEHTLAKAWDAVIRGEITTIYTDRGIMRLMVG
jgi:hypothetical protein